ncbi:MAG: hypothetical protein ACR2KG_12925 [Nocardioidaceae bacterium]
MESFGGYADLHPDPGPPPARVRDPDDDYLVALAEATAAVIVTGDADLLDADLQPGAITPHDPLEYRITIGGFWRSAQQQVADEFDRLLER